MNPLDMARKTKHALFLARRRLTAKGRADARRRRAGALIDPTAWIEPDVHVGRGAVIGRYSWVSGAARIDERAVIGQNVGIAHGVFICCGNHVVGSREQRATDYLIEPAVVEDGCWIGANATVLPGVTVATGCIVAAGAVVTRSTEPDGLYAGVPARRIRTLP